MSQSCFLIGILILTIFLQYGTGDLCSRKNLFDESIERFECPGKFNDKAESYCCGFHYQICCDFSKYYNLPLILFLLYAAICASIGLALILCYCVKWCPLAKRGITQGTVIQLPQGVTPAGTPGVRMPTYDMEMVPIARQPYIPKGYDTNQPYYPQKLDVAEERRQCPTYSLD